MSAPSSTISLQVSEWPLEALVDDAVDSSAEDDSNNVLSRPTISNKDNDRIRS